MAGRSPFPPMPLDEALMLASAIWEHNAGHPMRRVTIFHTLDRQPESSTSRQLITASAGYGLTEGNYKSEMIKLTDRGRSIVEDNDTEERLSAVLDVDLFRAFFDQYRDKSIPNRAAAVDFLRSQGIPEEAAPGCLDVILKNGRQVGLIHEMSGKERIISPDHALELLAKSANGSEPTPITINLAEPKVPTESKAVPQPIVEVPVKHNGQLPTLHIDIQIHIAADASTDQIDQIFASMAKHLYSRS
jgi:hypothetical protein